MSEWSSKDVYEIFKDFYGEYRVDFNEHDIYDNILVYFPEEIVTTNETGNSTKIYDTYLKFELDKSGRLRYKFELNRTTYTAEQFHSGYRHSHATKLYTDIKQFSNVCLGNGPLVKTTCSLSCNSSEDYKDENMWKLLFFEVQNWLRTESLSGGPYIRIDNINYIAFKEFSLLEKGDFSGLYIQDCLDNTIIDILKEFVRYFINTTDLKFSFIDKYRLSYSLYTFTKIVSRSFVEWANSNSKNININVLYKLIISGKIDNGKLKYSYNKISYAININNNLQEVLVFKGEPKYLKILDIDTNSENNLYTILNPIIVNHIMNTIENSINYLYGREENIFTENTYLV